MEWFYRLEELIKGKSGLENVYESTLDVSMAVCMFVSSSIRPCEYKIAREVEFCNSWRSRDV